MSRDSAKAECFWRHLEPLQGGLESHCRYCVLDPNAAEDVLQGAIAVAFRDFDLFAEGSNFRAWIYRYVNLTILAENRRGQAKLPVETGDDIGVDDEWMLAFDESCFDALLQSPDEVLERCDEVLVASIRRLSSLERSTLILKAVAGFNYREIADILGHPMGTVMSALSRARQRLRSELVDYGREHGLLSKGRDKKQADGATEDEKPPSDSGRMDKGVEEL